MRHTTTARWPTATDLVVAAVVGAAVLAESGVWRVSGGAAGLGAPGLTAAAVVAAAAPALGVALRRTFPAWAPLAPAAAVVWSGVAQPSGVTPFPLSSGATIAVLGFIAGGTAGGRGGLRGHGAAGALWGLAATAGVGMVAAVVLGRPSGMLFAPVVLTLCGVLPWLLGRYRRQQQALVRAGQERIAQLEKEQRIVAEQARLRERTALAEQMHHSLGHELSLIALQAGAWELAPELPAEQRAAAGRLRETAAAATGRLADILAVLRDSTAAAPTADRNATAPPAGRDDDADTGDPLAALVARVRRSGLAATLHRTGRPAAEVSGTVHLVVQEGLTNAAKHSAAGAVTVTVDGGVDGTTVTVHDPGPPGGTAPTGQGTGHGLADLRARVRRHGGWLAAGPADGGFTLQVWLPHTAAGPHEEDT